MYCKQLHEFERCDTDVHITTADGTRIQADGVGTVALHVEADKSQRLIQLRDVLIATDLDTNLLSLARLTDAGAVVQFCGDKAVVKKDGVAVIEANKRNGIYVVNTENHKSMVAEEDARRVALWKGADIDMWHRRFGHVSEEVIKKTIPITGMLSDCEDCMKGKADRKPFNDDVIRETGVLQRVHSDVCGPMEEATHGGSKYFVSFVDGFSRMASVYLIKTKDEVYDKFVQYKSLMENTTGEHIQAIRCDNGGEYCNNLFETYCKKNGIRMERTTSYSSQQNGLAERYNRTIMNMARTMLVAAQLEKPYWGEAVVTSAFIKNRLACKSLQWRSPYELVYKQQPKVENLKVFGSVAYARISTPLRPKLDQRGAKAIMLGYDESTKNYRLVDWENNKIIRSRDATFLEDKMGGCEQVVVEDAFDQKREQPSQLPKYASEYDEATNENKQAYFDSIDNAIEAPSAVRTTSGRTTRLPTRFTDYITYAVKEQDATEPSNYEQAMQGKDSKKWIESMNEEFRNFTKNHTWDIVDYPSGRNVLGCRWVFKVKRNNDGTIRRYKSRLVAKGYSQLYGEDYLQTYAPVADYTTLRWMLSVAASMNLKLTHLDFECAYLNGKLSEGEEIFMQIPPGMNEHGDLNGKILKLKKCLYGLKQSGRSWNTELNSVLVACGLKQSDADKCFYVNQSESKITMVLLYVDDVAIASNDCEFVHMLKQRLADKFEVKDLGEMKTFLGLNVSQNNASISIDQVKLIEDLLMKYNMSECNVVPTPAEASKSEPDDKKQLLSKSVPFRNLIGSLNYIANVTRPDISFAVNKLARNMENPSEADWIAAKRILRYLKGTKELRITFGRSKTIHLKLYTDADFGGSDDRKSTSGFIAQVNNAPIAWYSRKQSIVMLSTMEAEYVGLASAVQEGLFIKQLFDSIKMCDVELKVYVDNQSCIQYCMNERSPRRNTKHIDIKFHFVKDLVAKEIVKLDYVQTGKNAADICTKALMKIKHQEMLELVGIS